MSASSKPEELTKLASKVSVKTMYTFTTTYDRHKGRYSYRSSNFPKTYLPNESVLNYCEDPDWY
jgi:hypothetical protein